MCVRVFIHVCVCARACKYVCVYKANWICLHVCVCVCVRARACVNTCVYVRQMDFVSDPDSGFCYDDGETTVGCMYVRVCVHIHVVYIRQM